MFIRVLAASAAALLALGTPAAHAQQFSESYQFLDAVRKGDGAKVTSMLNEPGQRLINSKDRTTGEGALHIVTKRADAGYLRFLLQHDANPNIADADGNTPLMLAVTLGFTDGVDVLIRYHADLDAANSRGETPLIRAVQMRNLELVRALLAAGADPDKSDVIAGMSARDYAAADTRSPQIAKLLGEAKKVDHKGVSGPRL